MIFPVFPIKKVDVPMKTHHKYLFYSSFDITWLLHKLLNQ